MKKKRLPFSLSASRLGFLGLGLMGGSLALALKGKCKEIIAYDPNPQTLQLAIKTGAIDQGHQDVAPVIQNTDILILAAPVKAIIEWISALHRYDNNCIVLDIGSTKEQICKELEALPPNFEPVGGHPMCGKERNGFANASPDIFKGSPFALTELSNTTVRAKRMVLELTQKIESHAIWIDYKTHDEWVAYSSHLPYLISSAIILSFIEEAYPLIGTGFQSVSRLAGSDPKMMLDILLTNKKNVLRSLEHIQETLIELKSSLKDDSDQNLVALLRIAQERRARLIEKQIKS